MKERGYGIAHQPVSPVPPFLGRRSEIAWVTDQLDQGQALLAIYGGPHAGKTALLRQLARTLSDTYLPVYLDAGKAKGWKETSPLVQVASEVGRCVREQTGLGIAPPEAAAFAGDPVAAWRAYVQQIVAQVDPRPLLLLIDNAEQAIPEKTRALFSSPVPVVLSATERARLAALLPDDAPSPPAITLGALDHDAAETLIKSLVASRAQIDPWAVRRAIEVTSGHPHYVHLLCRTLLECCAYKSPLTPPDIEEALAVLLDTDLPDFVAKWQRLSRNEQYVLALLGALRGHGGIATQYDIQKSSDRLGRSLPLDSIVALLDALVEQGILEKLGANSYRFALELFRLWVQRHRSPEDVFRMGLRLLDWPSVAARLELLRAAIVRRRTLWISVAVVAVVSAVTLLPPLLRPRAPNPQAMATAVQATPGLTRKATPTATSVAANTPDPTPAVVFPGYDLTFMSRASSESPWQLYVMNSHTQKMLRITDTTSNERTPKWSPDGQKLVFASDRDGNREVYILDLADVVDGTTPTPPFNLTQHKAPDWQPAWSPDGQRVAFSSYRDGNWEIYVVNSDGTGLTRITDHAESDFSPTWSPDGTRLLFASRRRGDADLFSVDVQTGTPTQLTRGELDEYDPAWSPDGQWIAFVTQIGEQSDIFCMRADGSDPVNLTNSAYANDFQPAWTPASEWLVFVSYTTANGDHDIYRMRRDGSEVTPLTDDTADNLAPSWRPTISSP